MIVAWRKVRFGGTNGGGATRDRGRDGGAVDGGAIDRGDGERGGMGEGGYGRGAGSAVIEIFGVAKGLG